VAAVKKAIGNFDRPIEIIYPEIQLENQKKARYQLYLQVGNMEDILNMAPWDFNGVCETLHENNKRSSGKTITKPLNERQKDMIKRSKENKK